MKITSLVTVVAALILGAGFIVPAVVQAEQDFSRYTNGELAQMRTQLRSMSEVDRVRFQKEMQKRTLTMSVEERKRLGIDVQEEVKPTQQRVRTSEESDQGQSEHQRVESTGSYGSGYEARQGMSRSGNTGGLGGHGIGSGGRGR